MAIIQEYYNKNTKTQAVLLNPMTQEELKEFALKGWSQHVQEPNNRPDLTSNPENLLFFVGITSNDKGSDDAPEPPVLACAQLRVNTRDVPNRLRIYKHAESQRGQLPGLAGFQLKAKDWFKVNNTAILTHNNSNSGKSMAKLVEEDFEAYKKATKDSLDSPTGSDAGNNNGWSKSFFDGGTTSGTAKGQGASNTWPKTKLTAWTILGLASTAVTLTGLAILTQDKDVAKFFGNILSYVTNGLVDANLAANSTYETSKIALSGSEARYLVGGGTTGVFGALTFLSGYQGKKQLDTVRSGANTPTPTKITP